MDVKKVIKEKGFTINQVAEMMGKNRVTLSQTISRNPTVETLQKIADTIGCKVGDFFTDSSDFVAFVRKNGTTFTFDSEDDLRRWVDDSK